ncbi:4-(cytidine 5'-diphospho)-2-C-methyl-D-erythritol kinase [Thermophagus sp. OGC60D27]|uniref:4-(cytidine 5'-diphospho)-2-C-methyl-D-erythritol kinase n=1 Tax=Thermophagus sp. OGC60D27 TaxID=3458415 RepID=UPI004037E013
MVVFPNAKINLGLFVTEKRPDGFHNLETVFIPVPGFNDVLEVIDNKDSKEDSFSSSGINVVENHEDNLVAKALKLLRKDHPIPPLKVHLHKNIPAGAGLGGGSADAAFMLRLLNEQYTLGLSSEELETRASLLGADCAFFIRNQPVAARGTGNIFSPIELPLPGYWMMVVIPPVSLSTPEAYRNITPKQPAQNIETILKEPVEVWRQQLVNDFEPNAFSKYPELKQIKSDLYDQGALYAAMSGSGSAIFGIFRQKPDISWPKDYSIWCGKL